jgi:hypothetical protein
MLPWIEIGKLLDAIQNLTNELLENARKTARNFLNSATSKAGRLWH